LLLTIIRIDILFSLSTLVPFFFFFLFFLLLRRPPTSPLFPYTTLFRSHLPTDWRAHRESVSRNAPVVVLERPGFSPALWSAAARSEEHTSELQSPCNLVCRLLLEKKKKKTSTLANYTISYRSHIVRPLH